MSGTATPVPRPVGNYEPGTAPSSPLDERKLQLEALISSLGSSLSSTAAACLRNLLDFKADPAGIDFPKHKLAGVLILLHVQEDGDIGVTLTTRSLNMRSHPGDTALPGGRWEESDGTVEQTALREANEEIALPIAPSSTLLHLTTLPAFTSGTLLVVVPSVYLLTTVPAAPVLEGLVPNPSEVDAIFHVPLQSFLGLPRERTADVAPPSRRDGGVQRNQSGTKTALSTTTFAFDYSYEDLPWLDEKLYRLHSFASPDLPSAVTGLTADILTSTALFAFFGLSEEEESGRVEELVDGRLGFARWAEGQLSRRTIVHKAVGMTGRQHARKRKEDGTVEERK